MSAGNRIAIVAIVAIAIPSAAFGQARGRSQSASQVPRYTPHSPTVSPYVNLLNRNGGGAALNYYGLVRPLERQQSFNQNQSQQLANQGQLIGNQEQQINRIQDQQEAFSQPKVKATGTAGWFQNMGQKPPFQAADHYYGQWQGTKKARHGH